MFGHCSTVFFEGVTIANGSCSCCFCHKNIQRSALKQWQVCQHLQKTEKFSLDLLCLEDGENQQQGNWGSIWRFFEKCVSWILYQWLWICQRSFHLLTLKANTIYVTLILPIYLCNPLLHASEQTGKKGMTSWRALFHFFFSWVCSQLRVT